MLDVGRSMLDVQQVAHMVDHRSDGVSLLHDIHKSQWALDRSWPGKAGAKEGGENRLFSVAAPDML